MAEQEDRSSQRRDRNSGPRRGKGGRRGRGGRDEKKPPVPPALMRGPRPVKAKPAESTPPEEESADAPSAGAEPANEAESAETAD